MQAGQSVCMCRLLWLYLSANLEEMYNINLRKRSYESEERFEQGQGSGTRKSSNHVSESIKIRMIKVKSL